MKFINLYKTSLLSVLLIVGMIILTSFLGKEYDTRAFREVNVVINASEKDTFLDAEDIRDKVEKQIDWLTDGDQEVRLRLVETELEKGPYIEDAQVYKSVLNQLEVVIKQRKPMARIIRDLAPDAYVSMDGELMPLHDKYVARVLLITGKYTDHLLQDSADELRTGDFLGMLKYIKEDPFLKAQISQLDINKKGEIRVFTQLGNQKILLGEINNYKKKLKKLKLVFTKILPEKGWNTYQKIDLRFNKQIICE